MRNYELIAVLPGNLTEVKQKKVLEELEATLTSLEGKVDGREEWGKRELAYPIKKQDTGTYFFFNITIPPQNSGKLKRSLEVNEDVLRHLLVLTEGVKVPEIVESKESEKKKKPKKAVKTRSRKSKTV